MYYGPMQEVFFDFIILGAGPAGLAAAQYGARANLSVLVVENMTAGGQVLNINSLENYPGVFPATDGVSFTETMKKQAESFGARFATDTVSSIDKIGNEFVLHGAKNTYRAFTVLIATGAEHRQLGVPGEKELSGMGVSYCATCDGPFFRNKPIAVVGGGDAACDEATYLATLTSNVTLIHRRDSFRAQKAVAERVLNNRNITVRFNTTVEKICGTDRVESLLLRDTRTGEESSLPVNAVFIFVGMAPRGNLVEMLKKDESGCIITDENMATSIKGMFCAGDIRSKPFRQVVTAVSDGAVAAFSAGNYVRELKNESYR